MTSPEWIARSVACTVAQATERVVDEEHASASTAAGTADRGPMPDAPQCGCRQDGSIAPPRKGPRSRRPLNGSGAA